MAHSRANSAGWGAGAKLTSAQANTMDLNGANSLDKTNAGDTLSGVVELAATGQIALPFADGIAAEVAAAIQGSAAAAIQSTAAGGIALGGGSADWPIFVSPGTATAAPRTRTIWLPGDELAGMTDVPILQANASTAQYDDAPSAGIFPLKTLGGFFTSTVSGSSSSTSFAYLLPIRNPHNGATLSTVTLRLYCAPTRSNLPATLPSFGVFRADTSGNVVALVSSGSQYSSDPSASIAAYKAVHSIVYTAGANNVIDTSQYRYFLAIVDECGTTNTDNANTYLGAALGYTGIPNMAFP